MRVLCDVCERNPAQVMCCPDEAALCGECDQRVHAANKLANKHQRVKLIPSSADSICDICQEKIAFFFCMEDRAILCRNCDVAIHLPNTLSASHRRFLLCGIRVELNSIPTEDSFGSSALAGSRVIPIPPKLPKSPLDILHDPSSNQFPSDKFLNPFQKSLASTSRMALHNPSHSTSGSIHGDQVLPDSRATSAGIGTRIPGRDSMPGRDASLGTQCFFESFGGDSSIWKVDELLNIPDLADGYSLADIGSSKAEANNLGDFDWTADLSLFDEQIYAESLHEVPQMLAPIASSKSRSIQGSSKNSRSHQDLAALVPDFDDAFVPDIGGGSPPPKKRRY